MKTRTNLNTWLVMSVFLLGMACTADGQTIFVDANATGDANGANWSDAYNYLQDALAAALSGDEIWVAEGTYTPDQGGGKTPGDRTATFQVTNGVALYGGFAGGETNLDERDWQTNETILSGDLNGDDVGFTNNGENSYHVTTGSGRNATAVLDGFTITAGNANGSYPYNGGAGMYNYSGSPTLTKCTFSGNSADGGGGMYNVYSNPMLTNCTFSGNSATSAGGMYSYFSSPTLTNCTFSSNSATNGCGGMYNYGGSHPTLTNCTFSGNSAGTISGGMYNYGGASPTLISCTFSGNSADSGGGMYNYNACNATLTNCTFSGNSAMNSGGGMFNGTKYARPTVSNCTFSGNSAGNHGGGMYSSDSSPTLTNCTLWGNTAPTGPEIYNDGTSSTTVTYSDVEGAYSGVGNINADPNFVDANGPDNIVGTEDDNLRLSSGSPCIDAGDNTAVPPDTADLDGDGNTTEPIPFDLDGNPRFVDCPDIPDTGNGTPPIVDMGAYEFQNTPPVADAGIDQAVHLGTVVTLDGSGSSDPEGNYPLTYFWQIGAMPEGSTTELWDSDTVNPTFIPDLMGDYIIELVVTDSLGLESTPDSVLVSTYNTPPVADAGDDQAIIVLGTTVQLDGSQSYDDEGDIPLAYLWTITGKPAESLAELSDPYLAMPTFVADVHGDYVIRLIVTDIFAAESEPDTVAMSFTNVQPVADAGDGQAVIVGETVPLDGSGSYDNNLDELTYSWSFVSKPEGSVAVLSDPTSVQTSFVADWPGTYVVSLVVNDGFVDSEPDNVTIEVISTQDAVVETIFELIDQVNLLPAESLKNKNMKKPLINKINAVLNKIDRGFYDEALDKLQNDILQKTNGCADTGQPDRNDWITTCEEQGQVYPLIIEAIELLENLIE